MNRSHLVHILWALVTISTFVIGSQLAGSLAASEDGVAEKTARPGAKKGPGRKLDWGSGSNFRGASRSKISPFRERAARSLSKRRGSSRSSQTSLAEESYDGRGPMPKKMMTSLVRTAIKGNTPIERRKAFDRILEEIRKPGFSFEQAMSIRGAMAKEGASGELWKLFDYAWGASQPNVAVAHLDEINPKYRDGFLYNMIPGLASEHPNMAIELFQSLDSKLQGKVRGRFLEGLVDNGVEVATDHLFDVNDPNWRPMDQLAREIAKDQGLEATLAWATDLPEGSLRGNAWSAAYAVWGSQDPHAAAVSIIEMQPSGDRNQAINGFISAHAHEDGERAVAWAAEITSPGMRNSALTRAGKQYYRQDPEGAAAWFQTSGLPQEAWKEVAAPRN